jgi:hypothetical protein
METFMKASLRIVGAALCIFGGTNVSIAAQPSPHAISTPTTLTLVQSKKKKKQTPAECLAACTAQGKTAKSCSRKCN